MTEQISKAFRAWLATLERGQPVELEQAFAAGYRAAMAPIAREWDLDMTTAPQDGTIVEVVARYPNAMNGYPRYAGFKWEEDAWFEYTKHQPERVIPWAWRPRTSWPDIPKKTPNFETGIGPADAMEADNAS